MKRLAGAAALAMLSCAAYAALAADWTRLENRAANFRTEQDVIQVRADEGRFSKIKLISLEKTDCFGNGLKHDAASGCVAEAGGETCIIELPGGQRAIEKVEFNSRSLGARRVAATLVSWGRH